MNAQVTHISNFSQVFSTQLTVSAPIANRAGRQLGEGLPFLLLPTQPAAEQPGLRALPKGTAGCSAGRSGAD